MKPLVEFFLACILLLVGGCSAIAGIISASLWASIFGIASIVGLVLMLTYETKSKQ